MNGRRLFPDRVEWLLIAAAVTMFLMGAILVVSSPAWWGWYLQLLDPWYWSYRAWIIAGAVLVEILVVIRFYAKNRKPSAEKEPGRIMETVKRVAASGILLVAVLSIVESTIPWSELHVPLVLGSHLLVLDSPLVGESGRTIGARDVSVVAPGDSSLPATSACEKNSGGRITFDPQSLSTVLDTSLTASRVFQESLHESQVQATASIHIA